MPLPSLEELLKAEGYTQADLDAVKPFLSDSRLRSGLERSYGALETQLFQFKDENAKWADWATTTNKQQLEQFQNERLEAVSRAGSLEARLKALDPTFRPGDPPPEQKSPASGLPEGFDPKKHGLVTQADVDRYASAQGDAIALAQDLSAEYKRLTGSDMLDYTYSHDGRNLRGMSALLTEARKNQKALPDFIESKFDFAGKRAQAADAAKAKAEQAIRDDERTKIMGTMGNPNTRPFMPSAQPFISQRAAGDGKTQQPWEVPAGDRRAQRLQHAMETQSKGPVN